MQTFRDDYFTAYRSLKLTRDAEGVLIVQFHNNGVDLSPFLRQTVKSQNSLRRIDSWGCLDENSPRN